VAHKPENCLVGLDFNYRATLWSADEVRAVMTPVVTEHVDVLITTIEDIALLYGVGCGQYSAQQIVDGDIGPSGRRRPQSIFPAGDRPVRRADGRDHDPVS